MDTNKIKKFIEDSGMFIYPSEDSLLCKENWRCILLNKFIEEKDNGSDKLSSTDSDEALRLINEFIFGVNYHPRKECSSLEEINTYNVIACAAMVMLDHYNLIRLYRENINLVLGKKEDLLAGRKRTVPPRIIMIETICNLLKEMWTKPAYSDWRLGQLIVNLSRDYNGSSDPFFLRDQPLIEMLRERCACNDCDDM